MTMVMTMVMTIVKIGEGDSHGIYPSSHSTSLIGLMMSPRISILPL